MRLLICSVLLITIGQVSVADDGLIDNITVYVAKKIITMDPAFPEAQIVAVRDGRILSVGRDLSDLAPWLNSNPHTIVETFNDKILLPGFIEAHGHPLLGGILMTRKLSAYKDIQNPHGPMTTGVKTREAAIARLAEYHRTMTDPDEVLFSFGFDIVRFEGHLTRDELDRISSVRPIVVLDNSQHFAYVNSAFIKLYGFSPDLANEINGVQLDSHGELNGQFLGVTAATFALKGELSKLLAPDEAKKALDFMVAISQQGGITTQNEMVAGIINLDVEDEIYRSYFDKFKPMRVVVVTDAKALLTAAGDNAVDLYRDRASRSTDTLIYLGVKAFSDDSFSALGMAIENPGYIDGHEGLYINQGKALTDLLLPFWKAGIKIHVHSNGNGGQENTLASLAEMQRLQPRVDHRFTFQHLGIFTSEQSKRMAALGAMASVNPYYLYQWGEEFEKHIGTDRAHLAARFKTLTDDDITVSMHSDTPVGPALPLEWVWIAVNRFGESGKVLAAEERVAVYQALKMITIDAAYTLGVEDKIGSISTGKFADFTVLEQDPFEVPKEEIRDIGIWGTILGGRPIPVSR